MYKQCLAALAVGATLAALPASAQSPEEEARVHFEQGIALFEDGTFEQAVIALERAYQIAPSFKILWYLGQVENELGHFAAALEVYEKYLAEGEGKIPVSRAAKAAKEVKRLAALVGKIRVESEVGGALIFIDGRKQGATPLAGPVLVDPGEHEVVAKAGGDMIHRELVEVAGGQEAVVEIEAGGSHIEPVGGDEGGGGAGEDDPDGPQRVWTWVALGVGGAALAAGGAIGGVVLSKASDLEEDCPDKQCPKSEWSELDTAESLAMTSNILIGVGAAAVVAGVVLFFVEPRGGGEEAAVSLAPSVGTQGAGVTLGGRF